MWKVPWTYVCSCLSFLFTCSTLCMQIFSRLFPAVNQSLADAVFVPCAVVSGKPVIDALDATPDAVN